jgi:hypothetical protein
MRRVAGSLRVLAGLSLLPVATALGPRPLAAQAAAPAGGDDVTELAKKTQNPVADLITVPLQNNLRSPRTEKEVRR